MKHVAKKTRLMIVDDHEMIRVGLRTMLQDGGEFQIVGETGDGETALRLTGKVRPHIVLLDLRMPGMDGIEICRRISSEFPQVAVIILTAFPDEKLARECIQSGARAYVLKDIGRAQLTQILRTVGSGESVIDPRVMGRIVHQDQPAAAHDGSHRHRDQMSAHQLTILRLIAQGHSNKEIGAQMFLSENTVKSYVQELLQKMSVHNRVEAAMVASKKGWI